MAVDQEDPHAPWSGAAAAAQGAGGRTETGEGGLSRARRQPHAATARRDRIRHGAEAVQRIVLPRRSRQQGQPGREDRLQCRRAVVGRPNRLSAGGSPCDAARLKKRETRNLRRRIDRKLTIACLQRDKTRNLRPSRSAWRRDDDRCVRPQAGDCGSVMPIAKAEIPFAASSAQYWRLRPWQTVATTAIHQTYPLREACLARTLMPLRCINNSGGTPYAFELEDRAWDASNQLNRGPHLPRLTCGDIGVALNERRRRPRVFEHTKRDSCKAKSEMGQHLMSRARRQQSLVTPPPSGALPARRVRPLCHQTLSGSKRASASDQAAIAITRVRASASRFPSAGSSCRSCSTNSVYLNVLPGSSLASAVTRSCSTL